MALTHWFSWSKYAFNNKCKLAPMAPRPFKQYYYNGGINVIIINNNYSSYYLIHVLVYPEEHGKYSSDNTYLLILS